MEWSGHVCSLIKFSPLLTFICSRNNSFAAVCIESNQNSRPGASPKKIFCQKHLIKCFWILQRYPSFLLGLKSAFSGNQHLVKALKQNSAFSAKTKKNEAMR